MSSRHRPLLLLLLNLLLLISAGDSTDQSQCSALLNLMQSFNSTSKFAAWQPRADCCRWDGVECDPASGLVTTLDLSNRSIAGKISLSLFNLTSLQKLNLAYNLFVQIPIPNEIGLLGNLTSLNLSNAGFAGQIPIGVAKLTNLVSLDLSTFYLNEVPASSLELISPNFESLIGNLSNLRELYLDGVNISASGFRWCAAVAKSTPKLRALSLEGCSITGPIDSLLELRYLTIIRLDQNELNSTVPDFFGKLPSLSEIRLSFCGLNGAFPKNVFLLKNLTVVDFSSNVMLNGSLPAFDDGSKLESLVLSGTKFSGSLPNSIGKLKSLTKMDLSNCQFSGGIPSTISNIDRLISLDLSVNNFTGPIPSALPPTISELILSQNVLNGSIPSSIGKLQHLLKLDLSNNSLSGQIPATLFTLPSLQLLRLNMNQLSGELQEFSGRFSRLGTVDLSNNELHGKIPRSVLQLPALKIFTLASNNFSGIVEIDWFNALQNLSSLDLSHNRISIQEKNGSGSLSFPKISTLRLVSCNLTSVPSFLRYQDQVNSLDLSNNKIVGTIPKWIWNIGHYSLNYLNLSCNLFTSVEGPLPNFNMSWSIKILDLHSNLIQGPIPLPPTNTVVLDYSDNNFSSSIPSNITTYLSYTVFFSLSNNRINGEIPPSICNARYLQVLDFSYNFLSGLIPPCLFGSGSNLGVLNLRGNQLHGTIPRNISGGCGLRTINLNGNHLKGQIPQALANCTELELLDIGNNHINGPFPFWLGNIYSLRVLVLRSNELYGPFSPPPGTQLAANIFPMLQIFDISSNNFSGSLPLHCFQSLKGMMISVLNLSAVQFKYLHLNPYYYQNTVTVTNKGMVMKLIRILTIFTLLDFSNNSFEGNIPHVIGELVSLNMLNFSHNALTGNIPPSVGYLMQLESLDLSGNLLSGEIPSTLSDLTFLSFLNLSNNNLIGRIPLGNQFSTFSSSSYEGNKGLCGSPLTKQCADPSAHPPSEPSAFVSPTEVNWQFVFIGLGFGGGLATVVGTLMFWETGKKWYNKKVDRMLEPVLAPAYMLICDYFADRKVGAVEEVDNNSRLMDEWHGRKFCVFCTKLEFSQGRVSIHHLECDCPLEGEQH